VKIELSGLPVNEGSQTKRSRTDICTVSNLNHHFVCTVGSSSEFNHVKSPELSFHVRLSMITSSFLQSPGFLQILKNIQIRHFGYFSILEILWWIFIFLHERNLNGTYFGPEEIEFVQGFGSIPSPRLISIFIICTQSGVNRFNSEFFSRKLR